MMRMMCVLNSYVYVAMGHLKIGLLCRIVLLALA